MVESAGRRGGRRHRTSDDQPRVGARRAAPGGRARGARARAATPPPSSVTTSLIVQTVGRSRRGAARGGRAGGLLRDDADVPAGARGARLRRPAGADPPRVRPGRPRRDGPAGAADGRGAGRRRHAGRVPGEDRGVRGRRRPRGPGRRVDRAVRPSGSRPTSARSSNRSRRRRLGRVPFVDRPDGVRLFYESHGDGPPLAAAGGHGRRHPGLAPQRPHAGNASPRRRVRPPRQRPLGHARRAGDDGDVRRGRGRDARRGRRGTRAPVRTVVRRHGGHGDGARRIRTASGRWCSPARTPGRGRATHSAARAAKSRPYELLYSERFVREHPDHVAEDLRVGSATPRQPHARRRQWEAMQAWDAWDRIGDDRLPHTGPARDRGPAGAGGERAPDGRRSFPGRGSRCWRGPGTCTTPSSRRRRTPPCWRSWTRWRPACERHPGRGAPAGGRAGGGAGAARLRRRRRAPRPDPRRRLRRHRHAGRGRSSVPAEAPAPSPAARLRPGRRARRCWSGRAAFDASVHWLVQGWPEDVERGIASFERHCGERSVQHVVVDVTGEDREWPAGCDVVSLVPGTGWADARNAGLVRSLGERRADRRRLGGGDRRRDRPARRRRSGTPPSASRVRSAS